MYNYSNSNNFEANGCIARGACSISPDLASIKEVMFQLLSHIAFYLNELNYDGDLYFKFIMKIVANIDIRNDYSNEQILEIFKNTSELINKLKNKYVESCDNPKKCKICINVDENTQFSDILKKGEQIFKSKQKYENQEHKYLKDILFFILKSIASNYLTMCEYGINEDDFHKKVLKSLIICSNKSSSAGLIKEEIVELSNLNVKIHEKIYAKAVELFGIPSKISVNASTRKNKAILISGTSFIELRNLLEAVKNTDIDVYTNGNLLVANSFPAFKNYKNLQGHFGNSPENTVLDFATFPGSILLTKREYQNTEYLYQGKFFGTSDFLPKGISHTDEKYTNVIENSLNSRGFIKTNIRDEIVTGINYEILDKKFQKIAQCFADGKIKKLILIGLGTQSLEQLDYFKKMLENLEKNTFVISFSHFSEINNLLFINVSNNYSILLYILNKIFEKIQINSENLDVYILRCDPNSMATTVYLKSKGIKNLFFANCPPTTINPSVVKIFKKIFDLKDIT